MAYEEEVILKCCVNFYTAQSGDDFSVLSEHVVDFTPAVITNAFESEFNKSPNVSFVDHINQ